MPDPRRTEVTPHDVVQAVRDQDATAVLAALAEAGFVVARRDGLLLAIEGCRRTTGVGSRLHNRVVGLVRDAVLRVVDR
jgi:hypothetical protein